MLFRTLFRQTAHYVTVVPSIACHLSVPDHRSRNAEIEMVSERGLCLTSAHPIVFKPDTELTFKNPRTEEEIHVPVKLAAMTATSSMFQAFRQLFPFTSSDYLEMAKTKGRYKYYVQPARKKDTPAAYKAFLRSIVGTKKERRSHERVALDRKLYKLKCRIECLRTNTKLDGYFVDVAPGGICVAAAEWLSSGAPLRVELEDSHTGKNVIVYVKVLGVRPMGTLKAVFYNILKLRYLDALMKKRQMVEYRCRLVSGITAPAEYLDFYDRVLSDTYVQRISIPARIQNLFAGIVSALLKIRKIEYKIAETVEEKEQAYRLVYAEYLKRGFTAPNRYAMFTSLYQLGAATTTFVGKMDGEVVVTMSAVADSSVGLPMDKLYGDVIDLLRKRGRRPVEFTMLAVKKHLFGKGAYSLKSVRKMAALFSLFRFAAQYSKYMHKDTDVVISINPCYVKLYRYLYFDPIGELRYYKEFENQPALAFKLDLMYAETSSRMCLRNYFFKKKLPRRLLRKGPELSAEDMQLLFGEKSNLLSRLSDQEKALLCEQNPQLKALFGSSQESVVDLPASL